MSNSTLFSQHTFAALILAAVGTSALAHGDEDHSKDAAKPAARSERGEKKRVAYPASEPSRQARILLRTPGLEEMATPP